MQICPAITNSNKRSEKLIPVVITFFLIMHIKASIKGVIVENLKDGFFFYSRLNKEIFRNGYNKAPRENLGDSCLSSLENRVYALITTLRHFVLYYARLPRT